MSSSIISADKFAYNVEVSRECFKASNQPLASVSLRAAIYEMLETESRINETTGLRNVSTLTIYTVKNR